MKKLLKSVVTIRAQISYKIIVIALIGISGKVQKLQIKQKPNLQWGLRNHQSPAPLFSVWFANNPRQFIVHAPPGMPIAVMNTRYNTGMMAIGKVMMKPTDKIKMMKKPTWKQGAPNLNNPRRNSRLLLLWIRILCPLKRHKIKQN